LKFKDKLRTVSATAEAQSRKIFNLRTNIRVKIALAVAASTAQLTN